MTDPQPEVLTTTTVSETPIADSLTAQLNVVPVEDLQPQAETAEQAAAADAYVPEGEPDTAPAAELPTVPEAHAHDEAESPADYTPDLAAIQNANGDASIWAHQFYELIGHTTGKWIDEQSLLEWLSSFGQQVQVRAFRSAFFGISNVQVPSIVAGDPSVALLAQRDNIAASFKAAAGLA